MHLKRYCGNLFNKTVILRAKPEGSARLEGKLRKASRVRFFAALRMTLLLIVFTPPVSLCLAEKELPVHGDVPDFTFTDQNGAEIELSDFKGAVWIADFIFTRCQGMCPMLTGRMMGLQEKIQTSEVKLVSFTVDPEYDTPAVLSEYAAKYKAQHGKWFFVTGKKDEMWRFITEGFFLGVAQATPEDLQAGAEPVMHSARFVLIDQAGRIRGYYDSSEPEKLEALTEAALSLAAQ